MRQHPRFVNPAEILIETVGRDDLRSFWMSDISKGGMFVRTEYAPPLQARVQVTLRTPEGTLTMVAEVVHVLTPEEARTYGREPGVGLQFVDLPPETEEAIQRYVEGVANSIAASAPPPTEDLDRQALLSEATTFLQRFEDDDLYGALDLSPLASTPEVAERVKALLAHFSANRGFRPAQAARMNHAKTILKKVAVLMLDEPRRLEYDFRHGLAMAEERLALGPNPDELQLMRAIWHRVFDGNWAEAAAYAQEALRCEGERNLEGAVTAAQAALGLDPFNLELRAAIGRWNQRRGAEAQPARASRSASAAGHS